jgi:hypothetical protein
MVAMGVISLGTEAVHYFSDKGEKDIQENRERIEELHLEKN